jgi:hypothetical protein
VGCLVIDADSAKEGRTWEYICKIKHKWAYSILFRYLDNSEVYQTHSFKIP